ncbi:MAG: pyruvate, phosphate dikinase, partial [Actinomycetota bacterium]|nr:pyruvate, phosphate dikinase [Actinomycetota bacterium]
MKFVLGGKGANLAEMTRLGLPVPPGFTITCQACVEYSQGGNEFPAGLDDEIESYVADLEKTMSKRLGDADDPLLVSVRSGAPYSMPGMMDTILNLGLNDTSVQGIIRQTDNARFAWDSYRRFIQMFGKVVLEIDGDLFENTITRLKHQNGATLDTDLTAVDLEKLVESFKTIVAENVSATDFPELVVDGSVAFPQDVSKQLRLSIEAVFRSWMNDRAMYYRQMNKLSDDMGTAVNVQTMVFGNKGDTSGTGVAFTRNPADGT